jgi:hypothetical protein
LLKQDCVEAEGLSDPVTVKRRLKAVKKVLGDLPVSRTFEMWRARQDSNLRPPD